MLKKIVKAVAVTAIAGGSVLVGASGASAAHCVSLEKDSPGFSYFGTDHVKEGGHDNEGQGRPHMGTPGASNCRETTGSPSKRAPGQNRGG